MDDAEAEAVLLALGGEIKWEAYPNKTSWLGTKLIGKVGRHSYDLWVGGEGVLVPKPYYVCCVSPKYEEHNQGYATIAQAKSACERHYATGKWE